MPVIEFLRPERLPTYWCPGCGDGLVVKTLAAVFEELKMGNRDTVLVSGIGCAARAPGYFGSRASTASTGARSRSPRGSRRRGRS